jgi:hypothetical protein
MGGMPGYPSTFISAWCHVTTTNRDTSEVRAIVSTDRENDHSRP